MGVKCGPEIESILQRASNLAQEGAEKPTTGHLLLALMKEKGTANTILQRLSLSESQVRGWMRKVGRERAGYVDRVVERATTMARRSDVTNQGFGPGRVGGLHLLWVIAKEPASSANQCLLEMGHNTNDIAVSAMGCLTGGGQKALTGLTSTERKGGSMGNAAAKAWTPEPAGRGNTPLRGARARRESAPPRADKRREPKRKLSKAFLESGNRALKRTTTSKKQLEPTSPSIPCGSTAKAKPARAPLMRLTKGGKRQGESFLDKLGRDLEAAAEAGEIDPLVGREHEINRVIDALNRRRANVPCLVGEPGVGKTAIVEGMALRLARGEVRGVEGRKLVQVNVGDLLAGTGFRGALAEKLASLRQGVAEHEGQVVVFLDEVHSLLAATGGEAGEGAQELRTAMASGVFPCILATTPEAYRRYVEKDPGLERRLTRIDVEEPSLEDAHLIVHGVADRYAEYHGVEFDSEALAAAVGLSHRYLTERKLPDKAFTVLDLAGSRARRNGLSQVTLDIVARVVSELTGVPEERLASTDAEKLLELEMHLSKRIVGHEGNIGRIAEALRRNAAGLGGPRPVGSFLLLGPTGVGKTETARVLAEYLFPGGGGMSRFDMSELSEAHTVARLVGSPPGYVGHESGGQLTEAVRTRPYQVVLLDEVEKAHPKVMMLLLQVLEDGRLTDGRGRQVDFTNTVVIMTSNLGVGASHRSAIGFSSSESDRADGAARATIEAARGTLPPELWNRFDEVLYYQSLSREQVHQVARLLLGQTAKRLERERGIELEVDESVIELLIERGGYDPTLGARPMRRAIQRNLETPLAASVLQGRTGRGGRLKIEVVDEDVLVRPTKSNSEENTQGTAAG